MQFLAWGGENDPGEFSLITHLSFTQIVENEHYSGIVAYDKFAMLKPAEDGSPELVPVTIHMEEGTIIDSDYIDQRWSVRDENGNVVIQFFVHIDGRA